MYYPVCAEIDGEFLPIARRSHDERPPRNDRLEPQLRIAIGSSIAIFPGAVRGDRIDRLDTVLVFRPKHKLHTLVLAGDPGRRLASSRGYPAQGRAWNNGLAGVPYLIASEH